jgi:RHS repeat-associated protein
VVAITGAGGATAVIERFSYDPFGKRRNANGTDDAGSYQAGNNISSASPHRGYTGHEMLEEMGIVHMNGRLYDPRLGRVMSADPIVQAPAMSQSYNRYSYVMNGPLSLTDPSGFSWWTDFRDDWLKPAAAIVVAIYAPQISGYLWGDAYGLAVCSAVAPGAAVVQGATAGFLAGAITGGTIESAFYGGISGAAFGSLHGMDQGVDKVIAHGLAGGVMARAQGGDFGSGFLAAAFTQAASMNSLFGNPGEGTAMRAQNAIMAGIVGGTASVLGGGKFANGAVTGAMSRLLNDSFTVDTQEKKKSFYEKLKATLGSMEDFARNYNDMRTANTIDGDKYFHCKANCEAAQRGTDGESTAKLIADTREWVDQNIKGDSARASDADQVANYSGRNAGAFNPTQSCVSLCARFRPNGLDPKF